MAGAAPGSAVLIAAVLAALVAPSSGAATSATFSSALDVTSATTSQAVTYTMTGTCTGSETAGLAETGNCGSTTLVAVSASCVFTFTVDVASNYAGTTFKLCVDDDGAGVTNTVTEQTNAANDVTVTGTSAKMVLTYTPTSGTSGVAISFTFTAGVAGFVAADTFEFATTCGTAGTMTAFGTAKTNAQTLALSHTVTGTNTYKLCGNAAGDGRSDHVEQTDAPSLTISAASAGSDPVVQYGDKKWYIWLPPGKVVTMIQTPDVAVHATTFGKANSKEQWFDRFFVTRPGGQPLVDIRIKKNLRQFNRSLVPYRSFETLDVSLEGRPPLRQLPPVGELIQMQNEAHNVFFTMMIERMSTHWQPAGSKHTAAVPYGSKLVKVSVNHRTIGKAMRECVELWCPSVNVLVCSSPANEFYGFPNLMIDYAHLDMSLLDLNAPEGTLRGVLPEIWGAAPLSESTKAFLKPPKELSGGGPLPGGAAPLLEV